MDSTQDNPTNLEAMLRQAEAKGLEPAKDAPAVEPDGFAGSSGVGEVEPEPQPEPKISDAAWERAMSAWVNAHLRGTVVARNSDCWNHLHTALAELRGYVEAELNH